MAKLLISLLTRPHLLAVVAVGHRESCTCSQFPPGCVPSLSIISLQSGSALTLITSAVRQAGLKLWAESRGSTWQLLQLPVVHSSGLCSAPPSRVPWWNCAPGGLRGDFLLGGTCLSPSCAQQNQLPNLMLPLKYSVLVRPFSRPLLERPT